MSDRSRRAVENAALLQMKKLDLKKLKEAAKKTIL